MQKSSNQEIPNTILEQLKQSKVNGFPFFNYTGISEYNLEGNDTLYLKNIPRNPKKITSIQITYNSMMDSYKLFIFQKNQRTIARSEYPEIYFDQLAKIIVKEMGVN